MNPNNETPLWRRRAPQLEDDTFAPPCLREQQDYAHDDDSFGASIGILNKWEPFEQFIRRLYFDTTVYSQNAMELLLEVAGVDNVMFASEMVGAVNTIDPKTGRWFDDTKPYLDGITWLTDADRQKLFEDNAKRIYSGLNKHLAKA